MANIRPLKGFTTRQLFEQSYMDLYPESSSDVRKELDHRGYSLVEIVAFRIFLFIPPGILTGNLSDQGIIRGWGTYCAVGVVLSSMLFVFSDWLLILVLIWLWPMFALLCWFYLKRREKHESDVDKSTSS